MMESVIRKKSIHFLKEKVTEFPSNYFSTMDWALKPLVTSFNVDIIYLVFVKVID